MLGAFTLANLATRPTTGHRTYRYAAARADCDDGRVRCGAQRHSALGPCRGRSTGGDTAGRRPRHLDVPRMVLLGISFGGDLAAEYAVAYPERVDRLIIQGTGLAGPLTPSPWAAGFEAVAANDDMRTAIRAAVARSGPRAVWDVADRETTDRFLFHQSATAKLVRGLWEESGLVNTGDMSAALAKQPSRPVPLVDELAGLDLPVLVLVGLWDRNAGVDACRDLVTRLPRAVLRVFDNSAHFPNVEEPDRYITEIADFLG
ncbi:alpha/beta fold hydrolase [Kribbella sp. NPDC054772]